jgi:hypothetical protein
MPIHHRQKAKIERLFGFFQDRLINEIRLKGIKDYETLNRFLEEEFLPWYSSHYTLSVESTYRELTKDKDLELIFTIRHQRKVNRDNTIRFRGKSLSSLMTREYPFLKLKIKGSLKRMVQISYIKENTYHQ